MQTIVVRVTSMKSQTKWGTSVIEAEPVGDLFYSIAVPDEFVTQEGKSRIFTQGGIQHIFKGLQVALSYQTEEGDF